MVVGVLERERKRDKVKVVEQNLDPKVLNDIRRNQEVKENEKINIHRRS